MNSRQIILKVRYPHSWLLQVHPIQNTASHEIVHIGAEAASVSGTHRHSNPAFVVEMFLRENPSVQTCQPGRELESPVRCLFIC